MQAYSQDLRERVLRALDRGDGSTEIARRFEVNRIWVYQVRNRIEQTGQRSSFPTGALWHQLNRWNLTFKKTLHASEQEREDVQAARRAWSEAQPSMDIEKLVFVDETWASTNMTRGHGRAPRGQRCVASAPLGNWQTTTFVGGLRHDRVTAPMVADGPMDGEMFLAWVRQFLCPSLQPRDLVILDNLSSHKVDGAQPAIAAAGATLLYLPPYSPDLNPIEKLFPKLKSLLRKAAKRSLNDLWMEIGQLLNTVSSTECANYFASSGYVCT